jgi:16S rRNA U516 pseudouridylate synthase RsuA-like enzyme
MMAKLGYKVRKLRRVAMGPLQLRGLQPGQWRELTGTELRELRRAAGLRIDDARPARARGKRRR